MKATITGLMLLVLSTSCLVTQAQSEWKLSFEQNPNGSLRHLVWNDPSGSKVDALSHNLFSKLSDVLERDKKKQSGKTRIYLADEVEHALVAMPSFVDGGVGLEGGVILLQPGQTSDAFLADPRNPSQQLIEPMLANVHGLGFFYAVGEGSQLNIYFYNLNPPDPSEQLEKLNDEALNLFHYSEGDIKIRMTQHEVVVQTGRSSRALRPFGKKGAGRLIFSELTPRNMDTLEGTYAGYNITEAVKRGEVESISDDSLQMASVIQTLVRAKNRSVLLHGPAGTEAVSASLVANLAQKINNGEISELKGWQIVSVSYSRFGTDGLVDKGLGKVRDFLDVIRQKKVIVVLDQIEQLIGLGVDTQARGASGDVASAFVSDLKNGSIVVMGVTSSGSEGFLGMSSKHPTFTSQFRAMTVEEPTGAQLIAMLKRAADKKAEQDKVIYTEEMLRYIIEMTDRHIPGEKQPTKALQALKDLTEQFRPLNPERYDTKPVTVTEVSVKEWVAKKTGRHTVAEVDNSKGLRLFLSEDHFERAMDEKVVGHDGAKKAIRRSLFGILAGRGKQDSKGGELGVQVLMFLGPSGVGKSYLPRVLSDQLADKPYLVSWPWKAYEGSTYKDESAVNRLFGSSPGYVGYKPGGGSLFSFVKQNQQAVITLEEIDKMHNSVIEALYPFLEYGVAIDSNTQEEAHFTRGIVFMTSNYGSIRGSELDVPEEERLSPIDPKLCDYIDRWDRIHIYGKEPSEKDIELGVPDWDEIQLKEELFKKIENGGAISSQVMGRIGPSNLIILHHLSRTDILEIGRRALVKLQTSYWSSHQAQIIYDETVMKWLDTQAWGPDGGRTFRYGARSILSYVSNNIAPALGEFEILQGAASQKRVWVVKMSEDAPDTIEVVMGDGEASAPQVSEAGISQPLEPAIPPVQPVAPSKPTPMDPSTGRPDPQVDREPVKGPTSPAPMTPVELPVPDPGVDREPVKGSASPAPMTPVELPVSSEPEVFGPAAPEPTTPEGPKPIIVQPTPSTPAVPPPPTGGSPVGPASAPVEKPPAVIERVRVPVPPPTTVKPPSRVKSTRRYGSFPGRDIPKEN